jgi:uncharacterized delta-60 repeat protein
MKTNSLLLVAALVAALHGRAAASDIIYQTGFEPPEFTPGLPLSEQDLWLGGWYAPGTSHPTTISTANARDGAQCVRFHGTDAQGAIVGGAWALRPLFDLNDPNPPATPQIVEIRADVRLDGPQTGTLGTPQQDLISANLFAVVKQANQDPIGIFDTGGFFVSSAGRIWAYSWITGTGGAIYGNSIPYVMGTYHTLMLRVNFISRTLTYFVDGVELGSAPIPLAIKSEQLLSGYLSMYGGTQVIDTPELSYNRANYDGYFDNYSIASVPLTPADMVVQFAATDYAVEESAHAAMVNVERRGYTNSAVSVTLSTTDGTVTGKDYRPSSTVVEFAPGETARTVKIRVKNDFLAERDETVLLTLSAPSPEVALPRATAPLWILDDERAGSADPAFHFNADALGLATVYDASSVVPLSNGKFLAIVSGEDAGRNYVSALARFRADGSADPSFEPYPNAYKATSMNIGQQVLVNLGDRLVRLHAKGKEDAHFNVTTLFGSDPGFMENLVVQRDHKILVAGFFDSVNGEARSHIARLRVTGRVDSGFNAAVDDYIGAMALQPDGRILLGGAFQNVGGQPRALLARLNADGSLDTSFDIGAGFGDSFPTILSIVVQRDGRILVGGSFESYQGAARSSLVRLMPDGALDTSFDIGSGFESGNFPGPGFVSGMALQPDGKLLVSGGFGYFNGVWATGILRLNLDGSLDPAFQVGGNDSFHATLNGGSPVLLPDGDILAPLSSNVSFIKDEPVQYRGIVRLNGDPFGWDKDKYKK